MLTARPTVPTLVRYALVTVLLAACSVSDPIGDVGGDENLTGVRTGPAMDDLVLAPISGYGDYSDQDFLELDKEQITHDVATCVRDRGFAVSASGNSLSFENVPAEDLQRASDTADACHAGLKIPRARQLTAEEFEIQYERQIAVAACLADLGLPTTEPPALSAWIESYASGPWGAYDGLPKDGRAWSRATRECPEHPPGGYGSWRPGDPVAPAW